MIDTEVYFVQQRDQEIKIGWARSVDQRIAKLQTANPNHLKLLGRMPGGAEEERILHVKFARLRVRGEWFRPEQELIDFIAALPKPGALLPNGYDAALVYHVVNLPGVAESWVKDLGCGPGRPNAGTGYLELVFDQKETADLVAHLWNESWKKDAAK